MQEARIHAPEDAPVSTLELFLDLVFVFTITQITNLVVHPVGVADYLHALFILLMVWWMYSGYIWLTSNVSTDQTVRRLLMFGGMGGFLTMALSIPQAFGSSGVVFGVGYLIVTLIHAGLFKKAPNSSAQAIWGIFGYNLTAAALVLAAAFVPAGWRMWPWALAIVVLFVSGLLRRESGFQMRPAHFAERHGLILIIALGESVVALGVGVGNARLTPWLVVGALLGLALNAALWWSYFGADAERSARLLEERPARERTRLALRGFGFGHAIMIAGIIALAAGMKLTLSHLGADNPEQSHEQARNLTAWSLAAGVTLYLLGDVLFRRVTGLGRSGLRLLIAALTLLSGVVGMVLGNLLQMAVLVALLVLLLLLESRRV
ncbi:low temperature requirement protein A [Deinococcus ruber]|uniref:Low temperature requirement protein A n=1 Tax=Deinococcus ruber TaxID=1848197 RepID=A0A918F094_9DEIO|nr:low temperature requirement protein A [Deinococcus ruber]GGQ92863.1 low temperature requirement protein A [Deinococcus ruber]